jgi:hypothetical protein
MQSLGFSLKEIGGIADEYYRGAVTPERGRQIMADQLVKMEAKRTDLETMIAYVRAKIAWMDGGQRGSEPELGFFGACMVEELRVSDAVADLS